jgi:bacteriophage N4 adsorption protein B
VASGVKGWTRRLDGWALGLARRVARRHLADDTLVAVLMRVPADPECASVLVRRGLAAWPTAGTRIYVACAIDQPAVLGAVAATGGDPRLRIVVVDKPPGRAECLDRLYAALEEDERRGRFRARTIVLEDSGADPLGTF